MITGNQRGDEFVSAAIEILGGPENARLGTHYALFKGHLPGAHARLRRRRADDGQVRQGQERLLFH